MGLLVAAVVVLMAAVVVLAVAVGRLTRLRSGVEEAWRQLDLALQDRHAVVDELLAAVRPHAASAESADRLAELRAAAALPGAPPPVQARTEQALARTVDQILVQVDAQPGAPADERLREVRHRLLTADARIVERHRTYDLAAAELARALEGRVGRVISAVAGVHAVEPYDPTEASEPPDDRVQPGRI